MGAGRGISGLILLAAGALGPAAAQERPRIEVPSGQEVVLLDMVLAEPGPEGLVARFRFIAPAIARDRGDIDFETAIADMDHLCTTFALDRIGKECTPCYYIVH